MVFAYHGCMATHIHDRFFPLGSPLSACYRRLSRLVEAGYLTLYRLPSTTGQGSGKVFLQLGKKGRPVVAMQSGISLASMPRRPDSCAPLFALHHEAICTFRVALELAALSTPQVSLVEWVNEARLKRSPMRVKDTNVSATERARTITLIPDGAFAISYRGRAEHGLLEMDMGTLALKRLQLKLRGYLLYQEHIKIPVFLVVPDDNRKAHVLRLAAKEATKIGADPGVFFVTTAPCVLPQVVLTRAIWQQPGTHRPVALLPGIKEELHESP
jgi:Replication-relaxation